jgi:ABC-type cobalamin/Fe3+-siderophores transport system ATPase subunit
MQEKKSFEKLFQTQNINIRKSIRELDMGYDTLNVYCSNSKRPDVNILVVGPNGSGKSTLLRYTSNNMKNYALCFKWKFGLLCRK